MIPWKDGYAPIEVTPSRCPGCGADHPKKITVEWSLGVVRCGECDVIYVTPRVADAQWHYGLSHEAQLAKYQPYLEGKQVHPRDSNYREIVKALSRHRPRGKLLDVGCHSGFFLRLAKEHGWSVLGVEPSEVTAQFGRDYFGLEVINSTLEEAALPSEEFDLVTLNDVFEHLPNPASVVAEIRRVLRPDGLLFIKTPNASYNMLKFRLLKQLLRMNIDAFDPREHVAQYTKGTIARTLKRHGLVVCDSFVPSPIQSGRAWRRAARSAAAALAHVQLPGTRLGLSWLATDIAVFARRAN